MTFSYEQFVEDARAAAVTSHPTKAVRALLERTLNNTQLRNQGLPDQTDDEIHLFEDETVSVWSCRFQPAFVMPPHEHKMDVHIGVVSGTEKNIMYRREDGALVHKATKIVQSGEVLSIGADGIHAVTADGDQPSHALHIYLGPLMATKRDLFDWQTGAAIPFTMENFEAMKRPAEGFSL